MASPITNMHLNIRSPHLKTTLCLPVADADPVSRLIDMASEFVPEIDPDYCRVISKGRSLDLTESFASQHVADGATLLFVASSRQQVQAVQDQKSDPTIRGFELEDERDRARQLAGYEAAQDSKYCFCKFEFCERFTDPHPFDAERLLKKLATDPGVVQIMKRRQFTVLWLCEMDPQEDRLAQKKEEEGACLLGYNQNGGEKIYIRLRNDDGKSFRGYNGLVNTLLHELTHNICGPHDDVFWKVFGELKHEYEAFAQAERGRPGADVSRKVESELRREMGNKALSSAERQSVSVAIKSRNANPEPAAKPVSQSTLGGLQSRARIEARKKFADAAERRIREQEEERKKHGGGV
jgi:hypothetical protein